MTSSAADTRDTVAARALVLPLPQPRPRLRNPPLERRFRLVLPIQPHRTLTQLIGALLRCRQQSLPSSGPHDRTTLQRLRKSEKTSAAVCAQGWVHEATPASRRGCTCPLRAADAAAHAPVWTVKRVRRAFSCRESVSSGLSAACGGIFLNGQRQCSAPGSAGEDVAWSLACPGRSCSSTWKERTV